MKEMTMLWFLTAIIYVAWISESYYLRNKIKKLNAELQEGVKKKWN